MSYSLCYVSTSRQGLSKEDINELFHKVYQNNKERNITGILLYNSGNFFQYMEGNKEVLLTLFNNKIKSDDRHYNVTEIFRRNIDVKYFDGYDSGFVDNLEIPNKNSNIRAYLKLLKYLNKKEIDTLEATLNVFLDTKL